MPDNIRNYLTKHLNKTWMIENGFYSYDELIDPSHPLAGRPLNTLNLPKVELLDIETATVE